MSIVSFTNSGKLINRQYVTSTYSKNTDSIDKLSQGKKIRKTSDSVAESSINSKLINEVAVLKQSMINSMTYKSKLETAVSGLEQIDKILGEMQRISYKASSYIGTDDDREKLSTEFEELKNHIDFIVDETRYNGDYLLNSLESSPRIAVFDNDYVKFLKGTDLETSYNLKIITVGKRYSLTNLKTGEIDKASIDKKGELNFNNMKIVIKTDTSNTDLQHIAQSRLKNNKGVYISYLEDIKDKYKYINRRAHAITVMLDGTSEKLRFKALEACVDSNVYHTEEELLYTDYFNFLNKKPLKDIDELVFKNVNNTRFKIMKLKINDAMRNMTTSNVSSNYAKDFINQKDFYDDEYLRNYVNKSAISIFKIYGLVIPKKIHDPKEYSISYVPGSKYNEKFSISSSTALDIGLREENINLNNEENIKKSIEQVKKAKEIISESISKISVALNRVDFTMNNIDTMMVNTESAISAITDLDVSDELAKLSVLEMHQVSATEMIAHDIKSKYKLLKI